MARQSLAQKHGDHDQPGLERLHKQRIRITSNRVPAHPASLCALTMSVRELLDTLAGIQETVLIYPSTGGRPRARRMLTETTPTQDRLAGMFDLPRWAPGT